MSTYEHVARLALRVDGYDLRGLDLAVSAGWTRKTTLVRLHGGGATGVGEDVAYSAEDQERMRARGAHLDLAGEWTVASFSARLGELELHPDPPDMPAYRDYRRWAFEAAALDLALRQARLPLARALGREPRPLLFVASVGLGHPPSLAPLEVRRALHADLRFKLDATSDWDAVLLGALADMDAVDVVDFKGAYHGTIVDTEPDPGLYRRVFEALPEVWIEDPHRTPEILALLAGHEERVTWDAPLHSLADVDALPLAPECINVKPSRFGSLARLFEVYDACAERGIAMYGGGQFELGVGREQIQLLAALFHPDGPNDVAPTGYNAATLAADLPGSPLAPPQAAVGFVEHGEG